MARIPRGRRVGRLTSTGPSGPLTTSVDRWTILVPAAWVSLTAKFILSLDPLAYLSVTYLSVKCLAAVH